MCAVPPPLLYIMELCEAGNANRALISNSPRGKMIIRTCGLANNVAFNLYSAYSSYAQKDLYFCYDP